MSYTIGNIEFSTKKEITEKCRKILNETMDGQPVAIDDQCFLFDLFPNHDEWSEKSDGGVVYISAYTTSHQTRCFVLKKVSGENIDISFPYTIRLLRSSKTRDLTPQVLLDYKNAARTAIKDQISEFRDCNLSSTTICPVTGEEINIDNYAVDHVSPKTFDQLLFDFTQTQEINPLNVNVKSIEGVIADFEDNNLKSQWQGYHQDNAELQILSRVGNLQLPKSKVDWSELIS